MVMLVLVLTAAIAFRTDLIYLHWTPQCDDKLLGYLLGLSPVAVRTIEVPKFDAPGSLVVNSDNRQFVCWSVP